MVKTTPPTQGLTEAAQDFLYGELADMCQGKEAHEPICIVDGKFEDPSKYFSAVRTYPFNTVCVGGMELDLHEHKFLNGIVYQEGIQAAVEVYGIGTFVFLALRYPRGGWVGETRWSDEAIKNRISSIREPKA